MKKYILSTFVTLFVLFSVGVTRVWAANVYKNNDNKTVIINTVVSDDLYVTSEERVVIEEAIDGDLFVASGEVLVEGNIGGDVYAAGGIVNIEGTVSGTIFAAGGQVTIGGEVSGNVFASGGGVDITGDVGADVIAMGGTVTIDGSVMDDVRAFGGVVRVNNTTGGDLLSFGGDIDLRGSIGGDLHIGGDIARVRSDEIGGDLVSYNTDVELDDENVVAGEITKEKVEEKVKEKVDNSASVFGFSVLGGFGLTVRLIAFLLITTGFILLGLFIQRLAPVKLAAVTKEMETPRSALISFAVGWVGFFVLLVIGFFLALSVVGWPILIVMVGLGLIVKVSILPIVGSHVGTNLFQLVNVKKPSSSWSLTVGVVFLQLLSLIPCLGFLIDVAVFGVGLGALFLMKYRMLWGEKK